jgi:hypothetical protein
MNSDFDLDPATEDVIRSLRGMIGGARDRGVPEASICGALFSETVSILHETYGPKKAATMLGSAAALVNSEPLDHPN